MRIPKTLKIGGQVYNVVRRDHEGMNRNARGFCDVDDLTIGVDANQPPTRQAETLLHEVLHAVTHEYCVVFSDLDAEEAVVNAMAKGLYQVLRDNRLAFHD